MTLLRNVIGRGRGNFARLKAIAANLAGHPSYGPLYVTAKLNLPRLCGLILVTCIQRRPIGKPAPRAAFRMLVLNKAVFIEDVEAIASQMEGAELMLLGRTHLHFIAKGFFRKEVNDNNYHDLTTPEQITRYRDFLKSMWRVLDSKLNVKCALSGNFSYFEERELAFALEAAGVPFVVVHKECLKTPGRIEEYEHLYRTNKGPFWGSRILVYNEMEKNLIVRTGVTQADKVKVVGMPRLDRMHQGRFAGQAAAARKTVVLVSFHKDLNSLPPADADSEASDEPAVKAAPPNLENVWECVHAAMFELARNHPEVDVVIKTKGNSRDHQWLAELTERHGFDDDIANLRIVHGGELRDHVLGATVICGLHSTGLLEALAANKRVIIPVFDESADAGNQHHFIDFGESVTCAASKQEFLARIEHELQQEATLDRRLPEATRALLDHWLGNSDGAASARAASEIKKLTDQSARAEL
jgi:hypothetical protein